MTKVESILQALLADVTSAMPTVKVARSRRASVGETELPFLNIKPNIDEATNYANALTRQELTVDFELYLAPQDVPDSAADAHVQTLHETLMGSAALPVLVANVQYKSRQWQFEDADGDAVKLTIVYLFIYLNAKNTI